MKKLFFFGASLCSGGAEHQCSQLMTFLADRGYDVTYVTFYDFPDFYDLDNRIKRVKLAPGRSSLVKLMAIQKYMLKLEADVLIPFSPRLSVFSLIPLLLKRNIKVISCERNCTIGPSDIYEKILVKTGLYKRANYIVPNSYSQSQHIADIFPAIKNKIKTITNYTNIDLYRYTDVPNNDIIRIGVFCRFERQKNFHRFIEALSNLVKKGYKTFHVDWYGNHNFSNPEQLDYFKFGIDKIHDYKLDQYITIHEPTKEVSKLIPSFDALCLPSLHEGFSNSISEYICCGRPVLCSDVSDNSIMVKDGKNGFLFNPEDINDIVNAFLKYFATTESERKIMGIESRHIAESLFNKETFVNSYIQLIES